MLLCGLNETKLQLEHEEPDVPFLILTSYDDGAEQMNKADFPDGYCSVTFRFWAPRGENTVVNLASFEDWEQPARLAAYNKCTPVPRWSTA